MIPGGPDDWRFSSFDVAFVVFLLTSQLVNRLLSHPCSPAFSFVPGEMRRVPSITELRRVI